MMSETNIETRLNTLEQQVERILVRLNVSNDEKHQLKDWRRSLGMFDSNPMMQEIDKEGQQIRQRDRDQIANDHP
jgi:hypothetical protein